VIEDAIDATPVEAGAARLHTALGPAPTHGDPILLERLAADLIDNALRYNVTGGAVRVSTATAGARPGGGLTVTVSLPASG
jgi:signal transduction histidine kinase